MGSLIKETYTNWSDGIVNSVEPDEAPPTAYVRGLNIALTSMGGGKAVPKRRAGISTLNRTPLTEHSGDNAIRSMFEYRRHSTGTFTRYCLLSDDGGALSSIDPDSGVVTVLSATAWNASVVNLAPSYVTVNNVCLMAGDDDAGHLLVGTTLYIGGIGIVEPSSAPTIADAGDAGNHNGTYEARVTFYDSVTGSESSAGPTSGSASITNSSINWASIPTSGQGGAVTHRRLYLRNTATMSNFYLAGTVADNSTTTATTNLLDSSLTFIGPDRDENDPAPSTVKYLAYHKSRVFAADDSNVYFSKLTKLENGDSGFRAFDPDNFETPPEKAGQVIMGIAVAFDALLIFYNKSIVALEGDDPDTWVLREISSDIGCTSWRSIVVANGKVYFWSEEGPAVLQGLDRPALLGPNFIAATLGTDVTSYEPAQTALITAAHDIHEQRIVFSVPDVGEDRNTRMLPFNYRLDRWESEGWDPIDASCLATFTSSDGTSFIAIGGYKGQVFRIGNATNDGVVEGTNTGTFIASGSTVTTVTDSGATFDTTGGGLVERKVTIVDADGNRPEDVIRPYIVSNNATSFTLNVAVELLTPGSTYTYYIGGPAMDFKTAWLREDDAFLRKRYRHVYYHIRLGDAINDLRFSVSMSYDESDEAALLQDTSFDPDFPAWDEVNWDEFLWCSTEAEFDIMDRFRIGRTGTAAQIRMRHYEPDADLVIMKIGLTSETLTEDI